MNSRSAETPAPLRAALIKYSIAGVLLVSILWGISGRANWIRAWIYIGLTLLAQVAVGLLLHRRNPDLMAERSRIQKGTKAWDKVLAPVIALVGPLAMWITAAADARLHWPLPVPVAASAAALCVCIFGILFTAWAMLVNPFFSGTVRIQSERGHKVIDRGPYGRLRHPGYTGALAFTLATPLALGSWAALIPAAITSAVLILRTALEDRTLRAELPGYDSYAGRVRHRLIPVVW